MEPFKMIYVIKARTCKILLNLQLRRDSSLILNEIKNFMQFLLLRNKRKKIFKTGIRNEQN